MKHGCIIQTLAVHSIYSKILTTMGERKRRTENQSQNPYEMTMWEEYKSYATMSLIFLLVLGILVGIMILFTEVFF